MASVKEIARAISKLNKQNQRQIISQLCQRERKRSVLSISKNPKRACGKKPRKQKTLKDEMRRFWVNKEIAMTKMDSVQKTILETKEECAVCMEEMAERGELRITDCFHTFHRECLEKWTLKQSTCPFCRSEIK